MSEQLKFIVHELNKPPFSKSFNLISFDNLDCLQLLQILTDVLAEIDSKQKADVREESADQTAIRILNILRLFKYKPELEMSVFRQGLVTGEKPVVYPILQWLFQKMEDLKKRAYLAKYLVKIDVPPEFLQDDDVQALFNQYEEMMTLFKDLHKQCDTLKSSGFSTSEIKKDIQSMEEERDQLVRRVDRLKRKVESHSNHGPMLNVAKNLRSEKERETSIQNQKHEQRTAIIHAEQRIQRLHNQVREMRQAAVGATPEGLMQRLEEEAKTNKYIVNGQLPKQIQAKKKIVHNLNRVALEPAMGQSDLEALANQSRDINAEINQLVEKRMRSNDPIDDKMTIFRQQATIIARKKEAAAENLREMREELVKAELELEEKRTILKESNSGEVLKGDDFKRYVNKLRTKSTTYKKKRAEMHEIKAEIGVLARSVEILRARDDLINAHLGQIESRKGVSGYRDTQEELEKVSAKKSELDELKGQTLDDISDLVRELNMKIQTKKTALAPIIKELRPLRQREKELSAMHQEKKHAFDTALAGYESKSSKLEQEVKALREEVSAEESRYHYLETMKKIMEVQQQRISDEMKTYVSPDPQERKKTYREQYSKKIQEQENLGKGLREKQKIVRESHGPNMAQMKMWKDFERLMQCKRDIAARNKTNVFAGTNNMVFDDGAQEEEDRLVL